MRTIREQSVTILKDQWSDVFDHIHQLFLSIPTNADINGADEEVNETDYGYRDNEDEAVEDNNKVEEPSLI
jgi:hypothetical protein